MKIVFEVINLYASYDSRTVIKDFNLKIEEGSINLLLGPNGCGKSTFFGVISGLIIKDSGIIKIYEVTNPLLYNVFTSYLLTQETLYYDRSVRFNITVLSSLFSIPQKEYLDELGKYGLLNCMHKRISELSSGMRQKLLLAFSFAKDSKILFLDEPDSNLDENTIPVLLDSLQCYLEMGKTIVFSTHNPDHYNSLFPKIYNFSSLAKN
ncbi:Taurine import ATP-binding protein TauB [anaerobic digester metagenome]